jgi:lysophospholipase L1-like esterase
MIWCLSPPRRALCRLVLCALLSGLCQLPAQAQQSSEDSKEAPTSPLPSKDDVAAKPRRAMIRSSPRAVFLGDSITQHWVQGRASFFSDNGFVGRGIPGETSAEMLQRFQKDVVALNPEAVLILAGTNDVAENGGPVTDEQIIGNLNAMAEMARASKIKVVIGSVPPATRFGWNPTLKPAARIAELNSKIKAWAEAQGLPYADFWSAMALPSGEINPEDAADTVHPNAAGYSVMEPIAKMAIEKALASDP